MYLFTLIKHFLNIEKFTMEKAYSCKGRSCINHKSYHEHNMYIGKILEHCSNCWGKKNNRLVPRCVAKEKRTGIYILMDGMVKGATNMESLDNWHEYLYIYK